MPTVRRTIAALLLGGLLALVAAPGAVADDASLKREWTSFDREAERFGKRLERDMRRIERQKTPRLGPLLRFVRKLRGFFAKGRREFAGEQASSPAGQEARRLGLRTFDTTLSSFAHGERALRLYARALRLARAGRRSAARRALRKGNREMRASDTLDKRSTRYAKRAKRAFAQVS